MKPEPLTPSARARALARFSSLRGPSVCLSIGPFGPVVETTIPAELEIATVRAIVTMTAGKQSD